MNERKAEDAHRLTLTLLPDLANEFATLFASVHGRNPHDEEELGFWIVKVGQLVAELKQVDLQSRNDES
jgi:hypothetical protein